MTEEIPTELKEIIENSTDLDRAIEELVEYMKTNNMVLTEDGIPIE